MMATSNGSPKVSESSTMPILRVRPPTLPTSPTTPTPSTPSTSSTSTSSASRTPRTQGTPRTPPTPQTPPPPPIPWIEDLLRIVNFDFKGGLIFLCLVCKGEGTLLCRFSNGEAGRLKGLYKAKHFEEGGEGYAHNCLQFYDINNSVCVKESDMESLDVSVEKVQSTSHPSSSSSYIFLHNDYGYFLEPESGNPTEDPIQFCFTCRTRLLNVQGYTRYCSLECAYYAVDGIRNSTTGKLSFPLPRAVTRQDVENSRFRSYAKVLRADPVQRTPPSSRTNKTANSKFKGRDIWGTMDFSSADANESTVAPHHHPPGGQGSHEQAPIRLHADEENPQDASARGAKSLHPAFDDNKENRSRHNKCRPVHPLRVIIPSPAPVPSASMGGTCSCMLTGENTSEMSSWLGAMAATSSIQKMVVVPKFSHTSDVCILKKASGLLRGLAEELENQCCHQIMRESEAEEIVGNYDHPSTGDVQNAAQKIFSAEEEACAGVLGCNFLSSAVTVKSELPSSLGPGATEARTLLHNIELKDYEGWEDDEDLFVKLALTTIEEEEDIRSQHVMPIQKDMSSLASTIAGEFPGAESPWPAFESKDSTSATQRPMSISGKFSPLSRPSLQDQNPHPSLKELLPTFTPEEWKWMRHQQSVFLSKSDIAHISSMHLLR